MLHTLTYADIDYDGDGVGRLLEETRDALATGRPTCYVYREHYDGSEQYRYKDMYNSDGNLRATFEYDEDNHLIGQVWFDTALISTEELERVSVEQTVAEQFSDPLFQGEMAEEPIVIIGDLG